MRRNAAAIVNVSVAAVARGYMRMSASRPRFHAMLFPWTAGISGRCLKAVRCRQRQVFSAARAAFVGFREEFPGPLNVRNHDRVPTSRVEMKVRYRGIALATSTGKLRRRSKRLPPGLWPANGLTNLMKMYIVVVYTFLLLWYENRTCLHDRQQPSRTTAKGVSD
jgi:hypothetical protein